MFAKAYELASQFTCPVVVSVRCFDGSVSCSNGAFVILNSDGWIVTVAHILDSVAVAREHSGEIEKYNRQVAEIRANQSLNEQQRKSRVSHLKVNPKWITNHSLWWGQDNVTVRDLRVLPEADITIGRLEPFDSSSVSHYPIIKNPRNLMPGTSLCKLGFPFHAIQASFDEATGKFLLAPGTLPSPTFPLEGIYTRDCLTGRSRDGRYEIKLLETSSPGLRGQSGGPIFDTRGTVWAIQSRTFHIALGFSPTVKDKGRDIEEHQFLNVGLGVHPELLTQFLRDNGVAFEESDY
jgi:hypothetical protein